MRRLAIGVFVLAALAERPLLAPAPPDLSGLAWLEGRWTGVSDGVSMEEQWTAPAGGSLSSECTGT